MEHAEREADVEGAVRKRELRGAREVVVDPGVRVRGGFEHAAGNIDAGEPPEQWGEQTVGLPVPQPTSRAARRSSEPRRRRATAASASTFASV